MRGHLLRGRPGAIPAHIGRALVLVLCAAGAAIAWPSLAKATGEECTAPAQVRVTQLAVSEAPLAIQSNFSRDELQAMASELSQRPPHPVLGFYRGTVGYRIGLARGTVPSTASSCSLPIEVQLQLVVPERMIELAKELRSDPCLWRAALAHYQRHATAASQALHSFAPELAAALPQKIDGGEQDLSTATGRVALEQRLGAFIDAALAVFSQSLATIGVEVDGSAEARALGAGCPRQQPPQGWQRMRTAFHPQGLER